MLVAINNKPKEPGTMTTVTPSKQSHNPTQNLSKDGQQNQQTPNQPDTEEDSSVVIFDLQECTDTSSDSTTEKNPSERSRNPLRRSSRVGKQTKTNSSKSLNKEDNKEDSNSDGDVVFDLQACNDTSSDTETSLATESSDSRPTKRIRRQRRIPVRFGLERIRADDAKIKIGQIFFKLFDDDEYYQGEVISGPEEVVDKVGVLQSTWQVRYEDDMEEDLTAKEILDCAKEDPRLVQEKERSRYCCSVTDKLRKPVSVTPENSQKGVQDKDASKGTTSNSTDQSIQKGAGQETSKDSTSEGKKPNPEMKEVGVGYIFFKRFEDDEFYKGEVISGPNQVKCDGGFLQFTYRVKYEEDDEEEDLTAEEIKSCPRQNPRVALLDARKEKLESAGEFEKAKLSLLCLPSITEKEAVAALEEVGPPFGIQAAMNYIQSERNKPENYKRNEDKFSPYLGMQVRKVAGGTQYMGTVTTEARFREVEEGRIKMWEVTYEDGTTDDLEWVELLQARADRPSRPHPRRGRQLGCLELFSGCGMVSQEFAERKWKVRSVDNSLGSNASDKVDVMKFELQDIGFVPDFIWASPPCFTYSRMAAGKHRTIETKEFEKTEEALEHNHLFTKMARIMHAAKAINPHLIVVIENPQGLMCQMPLMDELERTLRLYRTCVDYCAFGRMDKKPTHLWTNDWGLHTTLGTFRCDKKCPYNRGCHPIGARSDGREFNAAAIPAPLAEEVAEYVNAKFVMDRIRYTEQAEIPIVPTLQVDADLEL